jgi:hypothetical protein
MTDPGVTQPAAETGSDRWALLRNIGVNAVLPYVTYLLLTHYGIATVPALVTGAVFPATDVLLGIVRSGRVEALGIIVLTATGASVLGALWFVSPFLILAKGSLVTGTIGSMFLVSLACRRPLVFHIALTGKDAAARDRFEALWQSRPGFRHVMRKLTWIWAVALVAEAVLRLMLIPLVPIAIFLPISEVMWITFFAAMTAWSWRYGTRMRARMASPPRPVPPACIPEAS